VVLVWLGWTLLLATAQLPLNGAHKRSVPARGAHARGRVGAQVLCFHLQLIWVRKEASVQWERFD
jgi:hypothetical protein